MVSSSAVRGRSTCSCSYRSVHGGGALMLAHRRRKRSRIMHQPSLSRGAHHHHNDGRRRVCVARAERPPNVNAGIEREEIPRLKSFLFQRKDGDLFRWVGREMDIPHREARPRQLKSMSGRGWPFDVFIKNRKSKNKRRSWYVMFRTLYEDINIKKVMRLPDAVDDEGNEHKWTPEGLPVLRKTVSYSDLLTHIRDDRVKEVVRWETLESVTGGPDLRCLVVYHDGSVAKSKAPSDLRLLSEAMRQHNVQQIMVMMDPMKIRQDNRLKLPRQSSFVQQALEKDFGLVNKYKSTFLTAGLLSVLGGGVFFLFFGQLAIIKIKEYGRSDAADRIKMRIMEKNEAARSQKKIAESKMQRAEETAAERAEIQARIDAGDKDAIEELQELEAAELKDEEALKQTGKFVALSTVGFVAATNKADIEATKLAEREARMKAMRETKVDEKGVMGNIRRLQDKVLRGGAPVALRDQRKMYFDDVAGLGTVRPMLEDVVDFFKNPDKYYQTGSRRPRGILLAGPPGTGKTLIAKAIAGEAGVNFFSCNASEFVEVFVGTGAARVRDIFKQAQATEPAVIFIDELDAIGRERTNDPGQQERNQTLNQLLVCMDGMAESADVVVIGATNRADVLDPALIRAGRFDRKIAVLNPDTDGRDEVLQVHLRERPCSDDIDTRRIAELTNGFSGAMLSSLANQAALEAARKSQDKISMEDLNTALELFNCGRILDKGPGESRCRRTAVRMCAASVVMQCLPIGSYTRSLSIVPRERLPDGSINVEYNEDLTNAMVFKKRDYEYAMVAAFAGHVSEEVVFGYNDITMMSVSDLERARELARIIVYYAAVGEAPSIRNRRVLLYTETYPDGQPPIAFPNYKMPDEVFDDAEKEIVSMLREAREKCHAIVERNRQCILRLTEELLIKRVLYSHEIFDIFMENASPEDVALNRERVVPVGSAL